MQTVFFAARWLSLATLLPMAACTVPRHHGFDTPLDAVLTYQGAFARGDEDLEYRCLSEKLKAETGVVRQMYSTFRPHLSRELGCFGRIVLRTNSLQDNLRFDSRKGHIACLGFALLGHEFEVETVRELFVRVTLVSTEAVEALPLELKVIVADPLKSFSGRAFELVVEVPVEFVAKCRANAIHGVEISPQWKLASAVRRIDEEILEHAAEVSPPRRETVPEPVRCEVSEIPWQELSSVQLGFQTIAIRLFAEGAATTPEDARGFDRRWIWQCTRAAHAQHPDQPQ